MKKEDSIYDQIHRDVMGPFTLDMLPDHSKEVINKVRHEQPWVYGQALQFERKPPNQAHISLLKILLKESSLQDHSKALEILELYEKQALHVFDIQTCSFVCFPDGSLIYEVNSDRYIHDDIESYKDLHNDVLDEELYNAILNKFHELGLK